MVRKNRTPEEKARREKIRGSVKYFSQNGLQGLA